MAQDLGDPRRQEKLPGGYATQGQAVSAPYAEANMAAAEKTNPMNAESQMPGKEKSFLTAMSADLRSSFGFGKNGWWFSWKPSRR